MATTMKEGVALNGASDLYLPPLSVDYKQHQKMKVTSRGMLGTGSWYIVEEYSSQFKMLNDSLDPSRQKWPPHAWADRDPEQSFQQWVKEKITWRIATTRRKIRKGKTTTALSAKKEVTWLVGCSNVIIVVRHKIQHKSLFGSPRIIIISSFSQEGDSPSAAEKTHNNTSGHGLSLSVFSEAFPLTPAALEAEKKIRSVFHKCLSRSWCRNLAELLLGSYSYTW